MARHDGAYALIDPHLVHDFGGSVRRLAAASYSLTRQVPDLEHGRELRELDLQRLIQSRPPALATVRGSAASTLARRQSHLCTSPDVHSRRLLKTSCRIGVRPDSVQVPGETLSYGGCPPASLVWLSSGLRPRRAPREERLERGLFLLKVAVPSLPN